MCAHTVCNGPPAAGQRRQTVKKKKKKKKVISLCVDECVAYPVASHTVGAAGTESGARKQKNAWYKFKGKRLTR